MSRIVAGDQEAVRALYGRFGPPVYTLGLRMLGSCQSAEELTQDVFTAAWRKASAFDASRGRLSTWLMAIAHNVAVDRLRHEHGPSRPQLALVRELPEPAPVLEEDTLVGRESARRALLDVSPDERRLLTRAYLQGWTAREIARADGIPLGTVKTRLRTALIKMRNAQANHARTVVRSGGEAE